MIEVGGRAPWFHAASHTNPNFAFSSLGGRWLLLAFLPPGEGRADEMLAQVEAHRNRFREDRVMVFPITRDGARYARGRNGVGLRWFLDKGGAIARGYGAMEAVGGEVGRWVLIDPSLRIHAWSDGPEGDAAFLYKVMALPMPDDHAGVTLHAPVLITPRVLEPELCRRLIDLYETQGGEISGVMRDVGGKTVPIVDDFKRRRDCTIEAEELRTVLRERIAKRLLPDIAKAFQFRVTRIERYIVACYDAEEGGWFHAHRDNTTLGTAHRRFACSINLNADAFDGGDLCFPEFGTRTYRPPTGGAVVFSCSLLHQATQVTRGRRYAFLPFFFDEAGEEVRQANLGALALPGAPKAANA